MSEKEKKKNSAAQEVWSFVKVFIISAAIILLFVNFVAHPVTVIGRSMVPNLQDGEYGFTSILSTYSGNYDRGDVVVLKMSDVSSHDYWVKRIIGLPGETIEGRDNKVYINGVELDETWLDEDYVQQCIDQYGYFMPDFGPVVLADDEYFVMGDNRPVSKDSRDTTVGPVTADKIFGKHVLVLFPFSKIGVH